LQTKFMNRLEGLINFVGQVRGKKDPLVIRFRAAYNENMKLSKPSDPNDPFNPDWH